MRGKGVSPYLDETQPSREGNLHRWLRKIGLERRPKEIQDVLDESEQQGLIGHDEGDMIEGIFDLKQTVAREIMIPRTHLVSVSKDCTRAKSYLIRLLSPVIHAFRCTVKTSIT